MISRTELLANGVTSNEVQRHVRGGRWRRLRVGIYATRQLELSKAWLQDFAGELCWGGEGTAISHRGAAYLYGFDGFAGECPVRPDITVPASSACRGPNVHRSTITVPTVSLFDLVVVSPEVCLAQLGHVASEDEVELAIESALRHGITTVARLQETAFGSLARIEGARVLRLVLRRRPPDAPATASAVETTVLQILRGLGCRKPERRAAIGSEQFSFVVRPRRLAVSCTNERIASPMSLRRQGLTDTGWTIVDISMVELMTDRKAAVEKLKAGIARTQRGPARHGAVVISAGFGTRPVLADAA